MTARINPRSMLPMPTMGNGGRAGNRSRPLLSYSSLFVGLLRALMYVAHDITPEIRNIIPMAMVIPRTVLSGLLMSKIPVMMAQTARNKELLNIFMVVKA